MVVKNPLCFGPRVAVTCASALAGLIAAGPAFAGQCPPDKLMTDATKPVTTPASGVTDTVLTMIDLSKEPAQIKDRKLRLRKLVIQPNGVVPWHSHGDRPAIIYIVEGEILEHASNCAVPILHKAGEVARETNVTSHWWKNASSKTVTLLSADVQRDETDHNM